MVFALTVTRKGLEKCGAAGAEKRANGWGGFHDCSIGQRDQMTIMRTWFPPDYFNVTQKQGVKTTSGGDQGVWWRNRSSWPFRRLQWLLDRLFGS